MIQKTKQKQIINLSKKLIAISSIENNIKEVRISTLQKIVELGFGGQLQLYIKL